MARSDALPMIASARREGVRLTVETCPHYLTFTAEEVPDGATEFKCCPPIREAANRELLWTGLADGVIDAVVSDHSPCPVELKHRDTGDFVAAWGGIASLQVGLPAVWSGARVRGHELIDVIGWMADQPARPPAIAGHHRSRRAGARRVAGRVLQYVLLLPGEPAATRPGPVDGRRLGDRAATRGRQRLGGDPAGRSGAAARRRLRHQPLSSATRRRRC